LSLNPTISGLISGGQARGQTQYFLLPALDAKRIQLDTIDLIGVLKRTFKDYTKESFIRGGTVVGGLVGSKLDPNLDRISDRAWLQIISSEKITEQGNHGWIQDSPDSVLESSIYQFSSSLARAAKRFPERFGQLALRFPNNIDSKYVSAILDGFGKKQPEPNIPKDERDSWQPARIETIEAVLDKYQAGDDRESAMSFCWLIAERADENWSPKTIVRLVHYAQNHPDLELGKLNVDCDKNSDEATVDVLFQNAINCVRGAAASAIGQLFRAHKNLMNDLRLGIESLIQDPHPAVRMAAIKAIEPMLDIDRDLAIQWFCEACKDDLRVAACPRASRFINYILPSYIKQISPIIQQMVVSPLDDVALEGARQVTVRWLFHDFFQEEFAACREGTVPQRKGVAGVAVDFLYNKKYSRQCQELLRHFINDSNQEVRSELRGMFRKNDLFSEPEYEIFLKDYIKSQSFADDLDSFVRNLQEFPESLVPVAEGIFAVCKEFATILKDKARDTSSLSPYIPSKISSILLRLYEQAQGEQKKQIADQCLDIWDLLFENQVGRAIELTRSIEA